MLPPPRGRRGMEPVPVGTSESGEGGGRSGKGLASSSGDHVQRGTRALRWQESHYGCPLGMTPTEPRPR